MCKLKIWPKPSQDWNTQPHVESWILQKTSPYADLFGENHRATSNRTDPDNSSSDCHMNRTGNMTGTLPDWVQTFLLHRITSLPSPLMDHHGWKFEMKKFQHPAKPFDKKSVRSLPGLLLWVADPMCWSHLLSIAPRPLLWWDLPGHWKCHPKGLVGWSTRPCFQKPWSYKVWREQEFVEHENMQKKWCRNDFPVFRHD